MALRSVAFSVAAFVACVTGLRADINKRFDVNIRLRIDRSLASRRITEGIKTESETIWAPYGVRLHWADADAATAGRISLDAAVVRQFHERLEPPAVLGSVVLVSDAPAWLPIRLSFDATESALVARRTSTGRPSVPGVALDRELARALGRVLAHEIGHVLIGAPHDRTGLMRETFNAHELAEPNTRPFRLTCSSVDRLDSRLRALTGSMKIGPGVCATLAPTIATSSAETRVIPWETIAPGDPCS